MRFDHTQTKWLQIQFLNGIVLYSVALQVNATNILITIQLEMEEKRVEAVFNHQITF